MTNPVSAALDPNALPAGLFAYEARARVWRPDLLPHIVQWLGALPTDVAAKLVRLAVSDVGGLVAAFDLGLRWLEVLVEFDTADEMTVRTVAEPYGASVPASSFEPAMLDRAARRGAKLEAAETARLQLV
jgi:hypothetical protein